MFERFSDETRSILVKAQERAREQNSAFIRRHHLAIALVDDAAADPSDNPVATAVGLATKGPEALREALVTSLRASDATTDTPLENAAPFSGGAKKALEYSLREALSLGHNYIARFHLLLAVLREDPPGAVPGVFAGFGVTYDQVREIVRAQAESAADSRSGRRRSRGRRRRDRRPTTYGFDMTLRRAHAAEGERATTGDILFALTDLPNTHAGAVLAALGVTTEAVTAELAKLPSTMEDGSEQTAVTVDEKTGAITIRDPFISEVLLRMMEDGSMKGRPEETANRIARALREVAERGLTSDGEDNIVYDE